MHTIMYLDDSNELRESLSRYLEAIGYQVEAYASPAEGIEDLMQIDPAVLILDYDFGIQSSMTGADVAIIAKMALPDVPIVSFSGLERTEEYLDVGLYAELGIYHIEKSSFLELRELLDALTS